MNYKIGENISIHTYEYGIVSGIITKVKDNLITIKQNNGETIKVLI